MMKQITKKIKITNKGYVLTSRGMARTPIDRPYRETVDTIRLLIARFGADVVEVLDDGSEVKLTINNYASDNNNYNKVDSVESIKIEPVKSEEPEQTFIPKTMSRKERKRLEYQRRQAELNMNLQDPVEKAMDDEELDNTTESESSKDSLNVEITEVINNGPNTLDEVPVE
jgi:hypothetical protein